MSKANTSLRAVSIRFLQAGTFLTEDIHCYDSNRLLAKSGTFIDNEKLYKLKNLNRGKETIFVTHSTYELLMHGQIDIRRQSLEEKTGYVAVKKEAVELLGEIAKNKAVEKAALLNVSDELSNQLESTNASTILSLINALAPVDEYLQRHCVNTGLLNGLMGKWLGMDKEAIDRLVLIGLLHDCGKAIMPPSVLSAPRKLSGAEYQIIKTHPIRSYDLLADFPAVVRHAARSHHEKVDGTGYPDRLRDNDIPIEARITAISDIYDAMVSQRAYKKPLSPFGVMAYCAGLAGTVLDAELLDVFIKNMPSELLKKQVLLSDGTVGFVRSFDVRRIEYPTVEINGRAVNTHPNLFCVSMY